MGVLPVASPLEFELDLNGKKADWEVIVKIPFIGLKAMAGVLNFFFGFLYIIFLISLFLYSMRASSHTGGGTVKFMGNEH